MCPVDLPVLGGSYDLGEIPELEQASGFEMFLNFQIDHGDAQVLTHIFDILQ